MSLLLSLHSCPSRLQHLLLSDGVRAVVEWADLLQQEELLPLARDVAGVVQDVVQVAV